MSTNNSKSDQRNQEEISINVIKTAPDHIKINVDGVFPDSIAIDFSRGHPELHFSTAKEDRQGIQAISTQQTAIRCTPPCFTQSQKR